MSNWETILLFSSFSIETAMGVNVSAQKGSGSRYVKALYVVSEGIMKRLAKPWLWLDALYNISAEGRMYNECLKIVKDFSLQVDATV